MRLISILAYLVFALLAGATPALAQLTLEERYKAWNKGWDEKQLPRKVGSNFCGNTNEHYWTYSHSHATKHKYNIDGDEVVERIPRSQYEKRFPRCKGGEQ